MFRRGRRCRECRQDLVPSRLQHVEGSHGDVTITIVGFPVLACPLGHHVRHLRPHPVAPVVIAATEAMGFDRARGQLPACFCDPPQYEGVPAHSWAFPVDHDTGGFHVTLQAPARRCLTCGHTTPDPDHPVIEVELPQALLDAMEHAGAPR